ncbi:hypothetical protein ZIOFF_008185 [Zingiber officinale]|uniref:Uncharacterized protein n=1 Tax=Zingiber officinale TaxID=94328 RepID=A0A8J5LTJ5_ZINOF|nr:hypothetical protein ZIOFF_008185 [Zingiber officinale]
MTDGTKQILAKPIQLADQVSKLAADAQTNKQDCYELKLKAEKLAAVLRQAARVDLYERPARRIMDDTEQVLGKALTLVDKCLHSGLMHRLFSIIPGAAFTKMGIQIDNSIADVHWLIRVSTPAGEDDDDDHFHGLCPIAQNEPILTLIWGNIAALHTGHPDARSEAAAALISLARDNQHFAQLIITEDGVPPLLRLLKEGKAEAQENAARALGLLGRDPESVDFLVGANACTAFAKVLKDGPMKVQAVVAWAVAELASNNPKCQDVFAQNNVVRLLVGHLAFETVQEHSKYAIPSKAMSIHTVVLATNTAAASAFPADDASEQALFRNPHADGGLSKSSQFHSVVQSTVASAKLAHQNNAGSSSATVPWKTQQHSTLVSGHRAREMEDPSTKANMKAMAAKALWQLAKGNADICRNITESRALLCFAVLLEKGTGDVRYNSAMALMEITRVAEHNADLRKSAFKPNSPAAKAVIDQFLQILEEGEYNDLLIPSITAFGCLSRTFRATETRIIAPLVRLLDEKDVAVMREAVVALTKFACTENYLHVSHSQAMIEAGGARHLIQLVYLGEQVQTEALILLCYIAKHVPDSHELAETEVLSALSWASKQQHLVQDQRLDELLPEAKSSIRLWNIVDKGFIEPEDEDTLSDAEKKLLVDNRKKDTHALNQINLAIDKGVYEKIRKATTSKQAWEIMQKPYKGDEQVKNIQLQILRSEFEKLKMKDNDSVVKYFTKVGSIMNQMTSNGEVLDDLRIVQKVFRSLPKKYFSLIIVIEQTRDLKNMTLEDLQGEKISAGVVIQALAEEEEIFNNTIKIIAMKTKVLSFKEEEEMVDIKEVEDVVILNCSHCHKPRHKATDCWFKQEDDKQTKSGFIHQSKNEETLLLASNDNKVDEMWCLGALLIHSFHKQTEIKFDDKSEKYIFIGYNERSKAYKLYNPKTKKIVISRDVLFDEDASFDDPKGKANEIYIPSYSEQELEEDNSSHSPRNSPSSSTSPPRKMRSVQELLDSTKPIEYDDFALRIHVILIICSDHSESVCFSMQQLDDPLPLSLGMKQSRHMDAFMIVAWLLLTSCGSEIRVE